jgi:iron complex outermembrane receptor protein
MKMEKIITKHFLSFLLLGVASGFPAQEKQSDISEVQIYGKFLNLPLRKVNENITVISRKEIESSPARSVDELLAEVTGIDVRRRGSNGVQSDVSIRGSSFEQVMILVNGIRMNDSQTGHNSMSIPFDLDTVEKIEVVKGPAARRFGQNAYAGVINIITKPESEERATVTASGGDFGTYALGLSANFGGERSSSLVQLNSESSEGYRHNTDYKINNIFFQNLYRLTNGNLKFQAGIQEKKFGANGFYATPAATEQYEETQASVVSFGAEKRLERWHLNSSLYWRRGQDMYEYVRGKPHIYRNMHIGNNIGGDINSTFFSGLGTTGLGVELRKEFLVSNNLGKHERFLTQLFFEHHFSFFEDRLDISPGISWANYDTEGSFFYPGLDVGFDFNKNHKIYGNIAKVSRIPTFTDLYYVSKTETGNPDLLPEHAWSSEVGYRYQQNNFLAKISGFLRNSENSIDWVKQTEAEAWRAENIGAIETKGIEVELGQRFNSFVRSYSVGYTFLNSHQKQSSQNLWSRYVLDNLKHQFTAKLENQLFRDFTMQLVYRYNERVSMGSYQILDAKLSYARGSLKVYVLANNLTNSEYTETFGVPMPRRWFHAGFSYRIGL